MAVEIFSSKAPDICGRVADFLLYMKCQHHLVQKNEHSRPLVPALTVIGFAQYYMSCILAYPDTEFRRLEKIVANVPSIVVAAGGGGGGLSDDKEGSLPPEVLPKVIRRCQLPPGADTKSKQLLDGAFEDLMYELDLLPPVTKKGPPPRPPHLRTTAAMVLAASSAAPMQPKTATPVDKSDSSPAPVHSRSLTRRKYVQPTLLHTIGDDDDSNTNKSDNNSESERHRERELERASMSGPRQGFTRLHSWHADHKVTTGNGGGLAGVPHLPASEQQQQRHGGRASQPFSPPNTTAAVTSHADSGTARDNDPPFLATVAAGPPRGSVSSNASSSGYWGHGGRTPPPTRHNSTSVPDVSSTGSFNLSSSSLSSALRMTTPTSASVGSPGGGGPASPTASWTPLQYRPTATAAAAVTGSPRSSSIAGGVEKQEPQPQKSNHVRWEGVPPQQPAYAAPAAATSRSGSSDGSGGQSIKTERRPSQRHRHHQRFPSSGGNSVVEDDDGGNGHRKGETWEEFLRAQKKGEGYPSR